MFIGFLQVSFKEEFMRLTGRRWLLAPPVAQVLWPLAFLLTFFLTQSLAV